MWKRWLLLSTTAVCIAPVLIEATPRPGDSVLYLVPLGCFPIPLLLADTWPDPRSAMTLGAFGALLGLGALIYLGGRSRVKWRSVGWLLTLSGAAPPLLCASFALLGSGLIALIWAGVAAAVWNLFLLTLTRGIATASPASLWMFRLWLFAGVLLAGGVAVFGVLTGLCC